MKMPIRHMLFVTSIILAKFYNAGRNFLIWNQCNVTQPKKGNFVFRENWNFGLHKIPKKEILCRSLNFGRNYRGRHGDRVAKN